MPCVVADTSPVFYLAKLGRLVLLRDLYGRVDIPAEVWREVQAGIRAAPETGTAINAAADNGWLVITEATLHIAALEREDLDPGERSAIALAQQLGGALLIIDEKRGRTAAARFGLTVTGTLGVLIEAKHRGLLAALKPELLRLRAETGFRFSADLEQHALMQAGEANP